MYLASYRYYGPRATLVDKIIGILTFGRYSHSELILDEEMSDEMVAVSTNSYAGRSYIHNLNNCSKSENWDFVKIEVNENAKAKARAIHNSYGVVPYDVIGAILSVFGLNFDTSRTKMFCSEYVCNVLYDMNPYKFMLLKKGYQIYPNKLHKLLEEVIPNQRFIIEGDDNYMIIKHNSGQHLRSHDGDILRFVNFEDLEEFAIRYGIKIYSPYSGKTFG